MSIQTSFGTLGNLSLPHSGVDPSIISSKAQGMTAVTPRVTPAFAMPGPLPLPSFVFPAKASSVIVSAPSNNSETPDTQFHLNSGPPYDTSINQKPTISCIPNYSFNKTHDSRPVSPRSTTSRPGCHKRAASEFIGEIPSNTTMPLANDPCSLLPLQPKNSINQRRGHAHRRSAAISSGDLSMILKSKMPLPTSASLPSTPALKNDSLHFLTDVPNSPVENKGHENSNHKSTLGMRTLKNTRVGFSDDIQIIPRPLSLASFDSVSTMRHEHSISNSISSMASNRFLPKQQCTPLCDGRPQTAEPATKSAVNLNSGCPPKRRGSLPTLNDEGRASISEVSVVKPNKRWTLFPSDANAVESNQKSQTTSSSSLQDLAACNISSENHNKISRHVTPEEYLRRRLSTSKKLKNKKRVKKWAGSILYRKARQRGHNNSLCRHSSTSSRHISSLTNEPMSCATMSSHCPKIKSDTTFPHWKPRNFLHQEDPISPVIDLDAALGPFITSTEDIGSFIDTSQRAATRKRAMHSAAGLGGFSGPGMHYHRRAESAPEFENFRFGIHRLGSSSTTAMEDVFEEDEDEGWESTNVSERSNSSRLCVNECESDHENLSEQNFNKHESSSITGLGNNERSRSDFSHSGKQDFDTYEEGKKLDNQTNSPLEPSIQACASVMEGSTVADELSGYSMPGREMGDVASTLLSFEKSRTDVSKCTENSSLSSLPTKKLPPATIIPTHHVQSPFPSPASHLSYDAQLISTAPPSISSHCEFESLLLGEPGPELRISVDDVPSLTSSDSLSDFMTTGEALFYSNNYQKRLKDGQRSASFSVTTSSRKRSSIASLSRLVSSSHGDKSKLSNEYRAPKYCDGENQLKASDRGKRLSRLIKFWKKSDES